MKIWITRHGQTALNKQKLMQGLTDEPLNETGIQQAKEARKKIGDIHFDAVYASPLQRAIQTASIIGNVDQKDVKIDSRIIEVDFGNYELRSYFKLGLKMTSYWAFPELLPNPKSVESVKSMVGRHGYRSALADCYNSSVHFPIVFSFDNLFLSRLAISLSMSFEIFCSVTCA